MLKKNYKLLFYSFIFIFIGCIFSKKIIKNYKHENIYL